MRIEIKDIQVKDYAGDMAALTLRNWTETGCRFELDLDLPRYQAMLDAGAMLALGAFDGDTMVGYSTLFLSPHMFNAKVLCAYSEALFVAPEYRKSSAAYKLIMATEAAAKEHNCNIMYWHMAAGTRMPETMARRGYRNADIIMEKELQHG